MMDREVLSRCFTIYMPRPPPHGHGTGARAAWACAPRAPRFRCRPLWHRGAFGRHRGRRGRRAEGSGAPYHVTSQSPVVRKPARRAAVDRVASAAVGPRTAMIDKHGLEHPRMRRREPRSRALAGRSSASSDRRRVSLSAGYACGNGRVPSAYSMTEQCSAFHCVSTCKSVALSTSWRSSAPKRGQCGAEAWPFGSPVAAKRAQ